MVIVKYKFNTATDVLPTFNNGFTYTKTDIDNGDGTKTRTIEGNANPTSISFDSKTDLIEVYECNLKGMTSLWSAFRNCSNLIGINFTNGSINQKVNVFQAFKDCSKLKLLDLSSFTCYGDMQMTFSGCSSLTELKIPNAEVSGISQIFSGCSSLTELDLNNLEFTKSGIDTYGVFYSCNSLTNLDISNWDVGKINSMRSMFINCLSLTNLDISNWDVSSVTDMGNMFDNCNSLTNLDISNWDVSSVRNMRNMFINCLSLTNLDISNWDVSSVTDMGGMFADCSSLKSLNLANWDLKKNESNMYRTFKCSNLIHLDISNWKTYSNINFQRTFESSKLKSVDLSHIKSFTLNETFINCNYLESIKFPNIKNINIGNGISQLPKLKRIYLLNNSKDELLKLKIELPNTSSVGNTPSVVFVDQDMSGVTLNNNWIIDNVESTKIKLEEPLKSNSSISSPNNIVNRDFLYWNDKKSKYILSKNGIESETNHTREYVKTHTPNTYINYNLPLIYKIKLSTDTFAYELPLLPSTKYYIQLDSKCTNVNNLVTLNLGGTSGTLYSNLNEYATRKIELTTLPQLEERYLKLYGNSNMVKNVMVSKQPILDYIGYTDGIESFGKKVVANGEDKYEIELTTKSKENKKIDFESKFVTIDGTSEGNDYLTINEIQGNTWQDSGNLSNIKHLGELYVDGVGNPILDSEGNKQYKYDIVSNNANFIDEDNSNKNQRYFEYYNIDVNDKKEYTIFYLDSNKNTGEILVDEYDEKGIKIGSTRFLTYSWKANYMPTINTAKINIKIDTWWTDGVLNNKPNMKIMMTYRLKDITEQEGELIYIPHKSSTKSILLPYQLKKVGDIADRVYWDNIKVKYCIEQNINEINYTFSQNMNIEKYSENQYTIATHIQYSGANEKTDFPTLDTIARYYSDKISALPSWMNDAWVIDQDYNWIGFMTIWTDRKGIMLKLRKPLLETQDLNGAKKYLINNWKDIKIGYPLNTPNIIETNITSKIQLSTYANKTYVSCTSSNNIESSMIKGRYVEFLSTTDKIITNNPLCKINSVFDKVYWNKLNNRYEIDRNVYKATQTDLNNFTLDLNNDKIIFNTLTYLSPLRYMSNILLYEDNNKIAIKPSDYKLSTETQVREFLLNKYIYVVGNKTTEIINGINNPLRLYQRMETYFNTNNQLIKPSYIGIGIKNLP